MFEEMVVMRDGIRLHTFVYLPESNVFPSPYPAIVQRSPYGIGVRGVVPGPDIPESSTRRLPVSAILRGWKQTVAHGYAVVFQDTRGRFASEGADRLYYDDPLDGYDTVEWVATQPWCNGRVGMAGSSAAAITAYAAASQRPPHLKAIFAQAGSSDLYNEVIYEGQSLELERLLIWVLGNVTGLSSSHINSLGLTPEDYQKAIELGQAIYDKLNRFAHNPTASEWWMYLPLVDYPVVSQFQPFWKEILSHPGQDDFRNYHDFKSKIGIPAIHVTTWYDIFLMSNLKAFTEIQIRTGNQKLFIGPGDHESMYREDFFPYDPFFLWFDYWLKAIDTGIMRKPAISYYHMPSRRWRYANQWPPQGCEYKIYYLHHNGTLNTNKPSGGESYLAYTYNPRRPVQTIGGRCIQIPSGSFDQRVLEPPYRDDVLVYTGDALESDLEIAGNVKVILHASSTCKDTDFTAKLIDAHSDGSTMLILEGVIRAMYSQSTIVETLMEDGSIYRFTVDLGDISHLFRAGHRIQVDISSSNFPRRVRNTNSGHPLYAADMEHDISVAANTIYHDDGHPSYLVLPVMCLGVDEPEAACDTRGS
jgi:hypothetical protein